MFVVYEGREQQDIRGYRGANTVAIGGHIYEVTATSVLRIPWNAADNCIGPA